MLGVLPGTNKASKVICTIALTWQFCIWEEKLKKKVPSFHTLEHIFIQVISGIIKCNTILQRECELFDFEICVKFTPRPAIQQIQDAPRGAG